MNWTRDILDILVSESSTEHARVMYAISKKHYERAMPPSENQT